MNQGKTGLKVFMKIDLIKRLKLQKIDRKHFENMTSGTREGHLLLDKRKTFILDKKSFISVPAEVICFWTSGRHTFLTKEVIIPVPAKSFTFEKRKSFIFDKKPSILVPAGAI